MGSKGKKPRKPSHSQHLPKVGSSTENKRLLHEEQNAVLAQMGVGGAGRGTKTVVAVVAVFLVIAAVLSLMAFTIFR